MQIDFEFVLKFDEIRLLFIYIGFFRFEYIVERLCVEIVLSDCEVDEGSLIVDVRCKCG